MLPLSLFYTVNVSSITDIHAHRVEAIRPAANENMQTFLGKLPSLQVGRSFIVFIKPVECGKQSFVLSEDDF